MVMRRFKVVTEFDFDEATGPADLVSTATTLVQQSFAQIPGVGLVSITEVTDEVEAPV